MTTTKSSIPKERLHGFDLLKISGMIAIAVLHTNEAIFWTDQHPLPTTFSIYRLILAFAQTITYSGFTVIALSFFLIGKGRNRNFLGLSAFLFTGVLVLASFQADPPFTGFYWEWDIYWFLLASLLILQPIALIPRFHIILAGASFLMTLIPFWELLNLEKSIFSQALVGFCPPDGVGSWPLLPWIAWPVLFFCLGSVYRNNKNIQFSLQSIHQNELIAWAIPLIASLFFWGAFYGVPIGPHFYCHTLRQPPLIFWAHFIWILFFMRLSLVISINQWLSQFRLVRWISNLAWCRHFGATYLAHLPLLGIGILLQDWFWKEPILFDLYFIALLPTAELIVRLVFWGRKKFSRAQA